MLSARRTYVIIVIIILFFLNKGYSFTPKDGFGSAKRIKGKHFTIYYTPQLQIANLTQQLNIRPSDKFLAGKSIDKKLSPEGELVDMLDALFIQVCDILDMHLYSFRSNIKICRDYNHMNWIYNRLFNKDLKTRSFYVYSLNTIYISVENFKRKTIAHEIAHAVISHYFVVLPSVKIQEILAGYVEYQLRKVGQ